LDTNNPQTAIDWFVDRVAEEVDFTKSKNTLCPIPGSQCIPSSTHIYRTLALAASLAQRLPGLQVWPHLKFKQPMPRKIRDEDLLFKNLVCTAPVPTGDIILLDDVCTTGAHARAAQRRLVKEGAKGDISAISVARTMLDPSEDVFGFRCDDL
jgi:predicted amidophosphoribosyltransferase